MIGELDKIKDNVKEIKIGLEIHYRTIQKWCNTVLDETLGKYMRKEWRITNFGAESTGGGFLEGLSYSDALVIIPIIKNPIRLSFVDAFLRNGNILSYQVKGKHIERLLIQKDTEQYDLTLDGYRYLRKKIVC